MNRRTIIVTEPDVLQLRAILRSRSDDSIHNQDHLQDLQDELERATVVDAEDVPRGVVTIATQVSVEDVATGQSSQYTVVLPWQADITSRRISVLAPLGTALLGYREGDIVEWQMPGGLRRLRITKVEPAEIAEAS